MANQFLTTSKILQSSLPVLRNNLEFSRRTLNQYSDQFAQAGAKVGATVNARKPPKYRGRYGNAIDVEDIQETPVPIVVDKLFGVDLEYDDVALTLTMDNFQERYIDPVMARIANEIDATGMELYKDVYNFVGVPNTVPNTRLTYLNAGVKLDNTATPRRGKMARNMVVGSQMQATIADASAALFHPGTEISHETSTGEMKTILGFEWAMDQNTKAHTIGALGGTPLVNGANQVGSSLITDGWTALVTGVLKQGDVITIGSGATAVNGIVPNTATKTGGGVSTGQLQQFVVTADVDSDAGGAATIPIDPPLIYAGAFQTVTQLPPDNAAILIFTSASAYAGLTMKNGLAFNKIAFTRVMVDLPVPGGVDMGGRIRDRESGLAFRLVRAYDIRGNSRPTRVEALWGWSTIYPEWACRILSSE